MFHQKFTLLALLAFVIGDSYGCDFEALSQCLGKMSQMDSNAENMCQIYNEVKTCIAPLQAACESQATLQTSLQSLGALEGMCGSETFGSEGTSVGCVAEVSPCMDIARGLSFSSENPTAEELKSLCGIGKDLETCLNGISNDCKQSMEFKQISAQQAALSQMMGACTETCNMAGVVQCGNTMMSIAEGFKSIPKAADLTAVCNGFESYVKCLEPKISGCDQSNEQINTLRTMISQSQSAMGEVCKQSTFEILAEFEKSDCYPAYKSFDVCYENLNMTNKMTKETACMKVDGLAKCNRKVAEGIENCKPEDVERITPLMEQFILKFSGLTGENCTAGVSQIGISVMIMILSALLAIVLQ